ncbi:VanZ family protein [Actinacidiphila soli]|uniref:VanZ family protein n=1 Tax=Actinacidiphila soli TaxID=2487275 RepID=UPI000FCACCCA|nr:VanZ family protein [Actinacidiphila soli]
MRKSRIALLLYAIALAQVTLIPVASAADVTYNNVVPGRTIRFYIDHSSISTFLLEIGGNLLLCAPLGILLPLASRRLDGLRQVTLVTGAAMLLVETIQGFLLTGRSFDVDDLILNTAGASLAYTLYASVRRVVSGSRMLQTT